MILVLSPAKRLDYETPPATAEFTEPRLLDQSALLIERLRKLSPAEIASLMSLSDPLAALNHARYADWQPPFTPANAKQAAFAFAGDVYEGLDAAALPAKGLDWLQAHVRILSGLHGLLRPLDLMQPYRLEMGTRLANARGKDLYVFWGGRISELLTADLAAAKAQVLVNLASEEYFKAVKPELLGVPVIQPVFEDWKGGRYKIVSFFAKRARGLMARYAAECGAADVEALKDFDAEDYAFAPEASDDARWVFRRRVG
ncbi:MAG: peroxide stress protein YaaA [Rhodocyclaceae bacterium]|nr:peroxide stress protein YaaA [Rhodocyclaceae bacterium]